MAFRASNNGVAADNVHSSTGNAKNEDFPQRSATASVFTIPISAKNAFNASRHRSGR